MVNKEDIVKEQNSELPKPKTTHIELLKNNIVYKIKNDGSITFSSFDFICNKCDMPLPEYSECVDKECNGRAKPVYPSLYGKKDEEGNINLGWFLTNKSKIKTSSLTEVYKKIMSYLKDHIYFTEEIYYSIFTYWLIGTYFKNQLNAIPYIAFIGDINSGKSRGSDIIEAIGYRTMKFSNPTNPVIFRSIELHKPTIVIEEAEHSFDLKTDNGKDMTSTFNNGYVKGGHVARLEKIDDTFVPTMFDVFCFKAMSSTRIFIPSLFSRCIKFYMQQHAIKNKDIDFTLAEDIRGNLLSIMSKKLIVKNTDDYKIPAQSRLEQISKMFYIILDNIINEGTLSKDEADKMKVDLDAYIKKTYEDSIEESKDTLEQRIIETIHDMLSGVGIPRLISLLPTSNKIPLKHIAICVLYEPDIDVDDPQYKKDLKKMSVMVGLKMKVLNLKTDTGHGNLKVFNVDKHQTILKGLYQRYIPDIPAPKPKDDGFKTPEPNKDITYPSVL